MEKKTYPKWAFVRISTSTVLGCFKCKTEIRMYEPCWEEQGRARFYHEGCKPEDMTEARGPFEDKEK